MNIVVTGAASPLGQGLCLRLAGGGHRVFAMARSEARLASLALRRRGRILPLLADAGIPEQIQDAFESIEDGYGAIGALVNNPPCPTPDDPWTRDLRVMDAVFDAGLHAAGLCTRLVVPYMLRHGAGRIINIASPSMVHALAPAGPFVALRPGLTGFADPMSHDLLPHGILVSTLCPDALDGLSVGGPGCVPEELLCEDDLADTVEFFLTRPTAVVSQRLLAGTAPEIWH